jgi:hypothetical protein
VKSELRPEQNVERALLKEISAEREKLQKQLQQVRSSFESASEPALREAYRVSIRLIENRDLELRLEQEKITAG